MDNSRVRYRPGRTTFKGVEVCEYTAWDKPTEHVRVIAFAASHTLAEVISQSLNQRFNTGGSVSTTEPLPGGF